MAPKLELMGLPYLIIKNIAASLKSLGDINGDLNAFAMTCRGIYDIVNPYLYAQDICLHESKSVRWAAVYANLGTLQRILESSERFDLG